MSQKYFTTFWKVITLQCGDFLINIIFTKEIKRYKIKKKDKSGEKEDMYRLIWNSNIPKVIKWILYILLAVTMIYWIIILSYKILEYIRRFLHFISDKRNWWTFVCCIIILLVGTFIVAQFWLDLDPLGKIIIMVKDMIENVRNSIGEAIKG